MRNLSVNGIGKLPEDLIECKRIGGVKTRCTLRAIGSERENLRMGTGKNEY